MPSEQNRETSGREMTPAEFTRSLPEGEGAGPDAPETVEPTQGVTMPPGPGGSGSRTMAAGASDADGRTSRRQSLPDLPGLLATVHRVVVLRAARILGRGPR